MLPPDFDENTRKICEFCMSQIVSVIFHSLLWFRVSFIWVFLCMSKGDNLIKKNLRATAQNCRYSNVLEDPKLNKALSCKAPSNIHRSRRHDIESISMSERFNELGNIFGKSVVLWTHKIYGHGELCVDTTFLGNICEVFFLKENLKLFKRSFENVLEFKEYSFLFRICNPGILNGRT